METSTHEMPWKSGTAVYQKLEQIMERIKL
jgi:hypothetical protein